MSQGQLFYDKRGQADTQTDGRTDKRRTKWSLCTAMLRRRHKTDKVGMSERGRAGMLERGKNLERGKAGIRERGRAAAGMLFFKLFLTFFLSPRFFLPFFLLHFFFHFFFCHFFFFFCIFSHNFFFTIFFMCVSFFWGGGRGRGGGIDF